MAKVALHGACTSTWQHVTVILQHVTVILQHLTVILQHLTVILQHVSVILQHLTVILQHLTVILQHLAVILQHFAAIWQHCCMYRCGHCVWNLLCGAASLLVSSKCTSPLFRLGLVHTYVHSKCLHQQHNILKLLQKLCT